MRGRARRRDANEPEIVGALILAGANVQRLDGTGVPDLLVLYRGKLMLVEVKNPEQSDGKGYTKTGKLTEDQVKWWAAWGDPKPVIVHTADEALVAIGALRAAVALGEVRDALDAGARERKAAERVMLGRRYGRR